MVAASIGELVPVLQTAISPVILISGLGLLILAMTNRLGRTIDRARELVAEAGASTVEALQRREAQLAILWRRARLIRLAIILASGSALCAAFLIIALFLSVLFGLNAVWFIVALFVACLLMLVASLITFIREVNESLAALKLELKL